MESRTSSYNEKNNEFDNKINEFSEVFLEPKTLQYYYHPVDR